MDLMLAKISNETVKWTTKLSDTLFYQKKFTVKHENFPGKVASYDCSFAARN